MATLSITRRRHNEFLVLILELINEIIKLVDYLIQKTEIIINKPRLV